MRSASLERANRAIKDGAFAWEIAPVSVEAGKTETLVATDEQPPKARPDKIPTLKAAFREGGTVTAANSSSISDGAAALVHDAGGARPRSAASRRSPASSRTRPTPPRRRISRPRRSARCSKLFDKTGWSRDVDLYEINEAFAVVAMAAMRDLRCRTRRSTSMAAPARSAIRSAPPARAFW